jgi:uncharacterized membrane protein
LGSWEHDPAERTVEHRRPLEPDPDNAGGGKKVNQKTPVSISRTRIVALTSVLAALIAVGTIIAIPMPFPLAAITLAPIIIFVTSILLGPAAGLISSAIGSAIGYSFGSTLGTIAGGFSYWFLFGIVVARGPMGFSVGLLRKKNEIIAMILGVAVETLLFFGLDFYALGFGTAILDFGTLVDLVFVPVSYGILMAVRRNLNLTYLA